MCLQLGKSRIGVNWAVFEQLVDRQVDFDLTKIFRIEIPQTFGSFLALQPPNDVIQNNTRVCVYL